MSASMPPPPPPPGPPMAPMAPPPSGPPPGGDAAARVQGPAIALIVTAVVGGLLALMGLAVHLLGMGLSGLEDFAEEMGPAGAVGNLVGGALGSVQSLLGLVVAGFIGWAALEMLKLRRWTAAVVASVLAMIPCVSPCCFIGLPVGIWSLVVLLSDDVKASFRS